MDKLLAQEILKLLVEGPMTAEAIQSRLNDLPLGMDVGMEEVESELQSLWKRTQIFRDNDQWRLLKRSNAAQRLLNGDK